MTPATVFDWNHSTKGFLWRNEGVKHHVDPKEYFLVNTSMRQILSSLHPPSAT
jgi:hypothetical protein